MKNISRTLFVSILLAALCIPGAALAQGQSKEAERLAAIIQEGAKMMGEGHAMMMQGMAGIQDMDGNRKMRMMAGDEKMRQGEKMIQDGIKMVMEEEMAKAQGMAKPESTHDAKHEVKQ